MSEGPKKAGVLGSPIAHSRSPQLHLAAYRALGLHDWTYERIECGAAELPVVVGGFGPEWVGVSVTMPGKFVRIGAHQARILLAKNPAGWQEALAMVDKHADGVVIAVNGRVPDGEDLSWLWDVRFEHFEKTRVVAAGERGTDLAVRLGYAGVEHTLVHDTVAAIASCPPGRVEVVANYTAFLQLQRALARRG